MLLTNIEHGKAAMSEFCKSEDEYCDNDNDNDESDDDDDDGEDGDDIKTTMKMTTMMR
jgi:hypothetical protein